MLLSSRTVINISRFVLIAGSETSGFAFPAVGVHIRHLREPVYVEVDGLLPLYHHRQPHAAMVRILFRVLHFSGSEAAQEAGHYHCHRNGHSEHWNSHRDFNDGE